MALSNLLSNMGKFLTPKLTTTTYNNTGNSGTNYPGAPSSPWLPGSNAVSKPGVMDTRDKWDNTQNTGGNTATLGTGADNSYYNNTTPGGTTTGNSNTYQQPAYNYKTPEVSRMSWEQALRQAEQMYKPKYEASILTRDKMAADQREYLAQSMAARGYANPGGGKWESGHGNITQEQAIDQQNIANDYESSKMQYANALYDKENARADAILEQLINQQNQQNTDKWNTWNAQQNAAITKEQNDTKEYNSAFDTLMKILGFYDE